MTLYSYAILRSKSKPTGWQYEPITLIIQQQQQQQQQSQHYQDNADADTNDESILFTSRKDFDTDTMIKDDDDDEEQGFYYETGLYDSYLSDSVKDDNDDDEEYKTFMPISKNKEHEFSSLRYDDANVMMIDTVSNSKDITNKLFDAIARELLLLREEQGRNSNSCDSYNGNNEVMMKQSLPRPLALLQTCTWAELTNIAYSYAMRGRYQENTFSGSLAHEVVLEATHRLHHLSSLESTTATKTTATTKEGGKEVLHHHPIPRDVAQLAWSVGVMQADNYHLGDSFVSLIDAIGDFYIFGSGSRKTRPLRDLNCADLVQLSISLAHGRIDDVRLLRELYHEALCRLKREDQEQITKARYGHRTKFHGWEISILLWVQASLYLTSKLEGGGVYDEFSNVSTKVLLKRIQNMEKVDCEKSTNVTSREEIEAVSKIGLGSQERANLAWSLTVLERYDTEESMELLRRIFCASSAITATTNINDPSSLSSSFPPQQQNNNMIQLEHAHQLYQSYTILQHDCPSAVSTISPSFATFLTDRWSVEKSRRKSSSARHLTISRTLDLMKVPHVNEHEEDIDVAIVLKGDSNWTNGAAGGNIVDKSYEKNRVERNEENDWRGQQQNRKVAVEFDGPHHFTRVRPIITTRMASTVSKTSPRALGHTVLKYRLLKKKGWTVVRVPFYEFDKIPFWASMERQRYLQRLLKTHANIRFSDVDVSEYQAIVPNRKSRFD
uniref:RAP domain-containing protein n=1 Tax=Ditylum brightwellii TaxID=49249 RepID=A0A7S4S649_9STRA